MANELIKLDDPKLEELRRRWKALAGKIRWDVRYGFSTLYRECNSYAYAKHDDAIEGEVISKRETPR